MKVIEAINAVTTELESILTTAGLVNGLEIDAQTLESEKGLIFWPGQVTSAAGSKKEQYLTYTPTGAPAKDYGDGEVKSRYVTVLLEIFSRNRTISTEAEVVENALQAKRWGFEFLSLDYDSANQMHIFQFETRAVVQDEQ